MAKNSNLHNAKTAKNDEFYTQYEDIEAEMNAYIEYDKDVFRGKTVLCPCDDPEWSNFTKYFAANFERLGLKKFISTSYAQSSSSAKVSLWEEESEQYDAEKHEKCGRLFILDEDTNGSGKIDKDDLKWSYLSGNGDFRSEEVTALRDEADFIITNPPFSLFREFIAWVMAGNKKFSVIGNINAITYKEVFPLIKGNKMWIGNKFNGKAMEFIVPDNYKFTGTVNGTTRDGKRYVGVGGTCWFTNIDLEKRHGVLSCMSMSDNLRYNKKLIKKLNGDYGVSEYPKYDNYDAIEVPFSDAIPSDYNGVMGVPISFLDKYNPEQFEISGIMTGAKGAGLTNGSDGRLKFYVEGKGVYARILIKKKDR